MLACLSVTLCTKGATVRISRRAWLAGAGALATTMIAAACLAAPALGGVQPPPGAARPGPMVALGDSYTAGALLPTDLTARPLGWLRSTRAYPVLVAAALGASLTDVACASAGVENMTSAQRTSIGTNAPQLNALASDDSLVVLTLSGDDIGFM